MKKEDKVKKDKKIEFRVNKETHQKFIKKAEEQGKTVSELMRELTEIYCSV